MGLASLIAEGLVPVNVSAIDSGRSARFGDVNGKGAPSGISEARRTLLRSSVVAMKTSSWEDKLTVGDEAVRLATRIRQGSSGLTRSGRLRECSVPARRPGDQELVEQSIGIAQQVAGPYHDPASFARIQEFALRSRKQISRALAAVMTE